MLLIFFPDFVKFIRNKGRLLGQSEYSLAEQLIFFKIKEANGSKACLLLEYNFLKAVKRASKA